MPWTGQVRGRQARSPGGAGGRSRLPAAGRPRNRSLIGWSWEATPRRVGDDRLGASSAYWQFAWKVIGWRLRPISGGLSDSNRDRWPAVGWSQSSRCFGLT
ncbi:hypothetical protein VULLAG_LOCUS9327 [Vulpes lagopus]